jgi:hypothetical protein
LDYRNSKGILKDSPILYFCSCSSIWNGGLGPVWNTGIENVGTIGNIGIELDRSEKTEECKTQEREMK